MSKKKKARLGRGLGALLGDVRPPGEASSARAGVRELPIEQLQRGKYQPRLHMDKAALEELAETIRAQGIIQPLLVRAVGASRYEIIAGERRWRAAQLAGLGQVPVVVREVSDKDAMAVALIENIQRKDLNALEEAAGFQRLIEEFKLTHAQVAEAVGKSREAVSNLLRLLALHPSARQLLEAGELDMGHARALLALPTKDQPKAASVTVANRYTVRQTEALVKRLLSGGVGGGVKSGGAKKSADVNRLENTLSKKLGARVSIAHGKAGGKVVIHYHSLDELDGIIARVK